MSDDVSIVRLLDLEVLIWALLVDTIKPKRKNTVNILRYIRLSEDVVRLKKLVLYMTEVLRFNNGCKMGPYRGWIIIWRVDTGWTGQ